MLETFYATQQVRVLTGQGWPPAGIECCVVRGRPRLRSVHRERAGRVIEPRKLQCGVDVVNPAEDHIAGPEVAWGRGSAGSKSGACTQGSSRNLGYLVFSTVQRRRGRRGRSGPGPRGVALLRGNEGGRSGGSAERRRRSEARREARSRSRLIVPMRSGNSPQRTRRRGSGRPDDGACGGTDGGDIGPRGHLNATTQDSGAGSEGAEADPDDAGASC